MDPQIQTAMQKSADQYGISLADYQKLLAQNPPVYQAANQGNQYGTSAGGQYMQSPGMTNALQTLSLIKQYGGGQQQQAPPPSNPGGVNQDPTLGAVNLGAAALNAAGFGGANGGFAVYNPTPGQIPQGSKGGVSKVGSPISTSEVPAYEANGPGVFNKAPMPAPAAGGTPTPVMPANAPGAAGAGARTVTPFATAPPAPTATVATPPVAPPAAPSLDDHHNALVNAGKALY